jgi:hypothetical protein
MQEKVVPGQWPGLSVGQEPGRVLNRRGVSARRRPARLQACDGKAVLP